MGVVRKNHCYSARCKTFADGEQDNRIIWYAVPDDRHFYSEEHTFWPRVDDMFDLEHNTYEEAGHIPCPRKHYSGRDIWFRAGDHVHGDSNDFLGLSLSAKYIVHGNGPWDPCAEPEHLFAEFGLGVVKHNLPPPVERKALGFSLGVRGTDVAFPSPIVQARLALGVVGTNLAPAVERRASGIAFGIKGNVPIVERFPVGWALGIFVHPSSAEEKPIGLALGIVGQNIAVAGEELLTGITFGVVKQDMTPATETLLSGLLVGIRGSNVTAVEPLPVGIAFGVHGSSVSAMEIGVNGFLLGIAGQDLSEQAELLKSGIALGVDGSRSNEGTEIASLGFVLGIVGHAVTTVAPGTDCSSSGTLPLATPTTSSISSSLSHDWWIFTCAAGTQYTVTITSVSGVYPSNGIQHGSCGFPTLDGSCTSITTSFSFTPGGTTANVHVDGNFMGSLTYQITVTSP